MFEQISSAGMLDYYTRRSAYRGCTIATVLIRAN